MDVTHLIVGNYDTPKYRYVAKERPDVRPMTMRWIEAVRELWIEDKEIDTEALERCHMLPTFNSLKFSMTGCDDRTGHIHLRSTRMLTAWQLQKDSKSLNKSRPTGLSTKET
jgi:DNA replication regulator DPB11